LIDKRHYYSQTAVLKIKILSC